MDAATLSKTVERVCLALGIDIKASPIPVRDILDKVKQYSVTPHNQEVMPIVAEKRATLALARSLILRSSQDAGTVRTADGSQMSYTDRLAGWNALIAQLTAEGYAEGQGLSVIRAVRGSSSARSEWS